MPINRAIRIGGIYLAVSVLWITLSDRVVYSLPLSPDAQQTFQTVKGLVFVTLSAVLVTLLALRELRRAEAQAQLHRELGRSEERYRELFEASPLPMFVFDRETLGFLAVNDATAALYGWSRKELLEMDIKDLRPPEDLPFLRRSLAEMPDRGFHHVGIVRHRTREGRDIRVELTTHHLVFQGREAELVVANDMTERLEAERQLRQAQRMESVGRLAGGVAHDFNNLLTVVGSVAELAQNDVGADTPLGRMMEEILSAQSQGAALTRQLLTFSRQSGEDREPVELRGALERLGQLIGRLVGSRIRILQDLPEEELVVSIPPIHFEQVVMNLAVNARDAMPGGGELRIGLRRDVGWAVLTVADTGTGIPPEVQASVFEPFFTTKGKEGTGLGLSTTYGIVTGVGGTIDLDSTPGRGTTFVIRLPLLEEEGRSRRGGSRWGKEDPDGDAPGTGTDEAASARG